jgi:hypothetical protein
MPYGSAAERTPLLSRPPGVHTTQYTIDYSQEPITHVIPSQSGTTTYISTQKAKKCCSGLQNCSLACQSENGYSNANGHSMTDSTCAVRMTNDQECCGLGLGCGVKGEGSSCCRSLSRKDEIERDEYCDSLANQPWQYKSVALLCALFLAGMKQHLYLAASFYCFGLTP